MLHACLLQYLYIFSRYNHTHTIKQISGCIIYVVNTQQYCSYSRILPSTVEPPIIGSKYEGTKYCIVCCDEMRCVQCTDVSVLLTV